MPGGVVQETPGCHPNGEPGLVVARGSHVRKPPARLADSERSRRPGPDKPRLPTALWTTSGIFVRGRRRRHPRALAAEAHERDTLRRGWVDQQHLDERLGLEQQLTRARELARRRGIDVRNDVRVIELRIAAIMRKATRQHAA
jgi:hypothetical protein